MCGIGGVIYRGTEATGAVGAQLLTLLEVLGSRGMDGSGVALYTPAQAGEQIIRVHLEGAETDSRMARITESLRAVTEVRAIARYADDLRLVIAAPASDLTRLATIAEAATAQATVFSGGGALEIIKAVGTAQALRRYGVEQISGTHGIGHTRLATESRVDVVHCHPFWARPYADLAVVHNGQITNYHKLRRQMEMRGIAFQTENDSEIIGLYLADLLAQGDTLEQAMYRSLDELDGTFTYLVSTADAIGMARDRMAAKPLIVAETESWVAIASEEIALQRAFGPLPSTYQPRGGTVHLWQRAVSAVPNGVAATPEAVGV